MTDVGSEFTCEHCQQTFKRARPDAEARAEAEAEFDGLIDFEDREGDFGAAQVCESCYHEIMAWANPKESN